MFRMNFGGITTETHVAVDSNETDNRTSEYYQQYNYAKCRSPLQWVRFTICPQLDLRIEVAYKVTLSPRPSFIIQL